jgi:hypothetical protein
MDLFHALFLATRRTPFRNELSLFSSATVIAVRLVVLRVSRASVCYSQLSTKAYWGLLMLIVISVGTRLPVSSVLSACYCLDKHCVYKSLATYGHDKIMGSASTAKYMHTYLARNRYH